MFFVSFFKALTTCSLEVSFVEGIQILTFPIHYSYPIYIPSMLYVWSILLPE
jgi:hypothetical protein